MGKHPNDKLSSLNHSLLDFPLLQQETKGFTLPQTKLLHLQSQFSVRLSFIFKVATQKLNSVNDSCCCRSGRHKLTVPLLLSNRDYKLFSTLHRHCIDPKACTAEQWQCCAAPVLSMQFLLDSQSRSSLSPLAASSEVYL